MRYIVLCGSDIESEIVSVEKLEECVNEHIAMGWEPIGGVAFACGAAFQAMVMKGGEENG